MTQQFSQQPQKQGAKLHSAFSLWKQQAMWKIILDKIFLQKESVKSCLFKKVSSILYNSLTKGSGEPNF